MDALSTPRLLISGDQSGAGASFVTLGLIVALRRRGIAVATGTVGTHLLQSVLYRRISGRPAFSFDRRVLSEGQLYRTMFQAGVGAELLLVNAPGGILDGDPPGSLHASHAEFSALFDIPALVVFNGKRGRMSPAALMQGIQALCGGARIAGSIANRVSPEWRSEQLEWWREAFAVHHLAPPIGSIPEWKELALPGLSGTQRQNTTLFPRQLLVELGDLMLECVDIDALLSIARSAPPLRLEGLNYQPSRRRCRIAVSDDNCFAVSFQENEAWLRYYGAEVVSFSPMADKQLPRDVGAVYFTGAYLEEYVRELSSNSGLRRALHAFRDRGGVIYAEGAGAAFLSERIRFTGGDEVFDGMGLLEGEAVCGDAQPGYVEAQTIEESVLGRQGLVLKGYTTGEWQLPQATRCVRAFRCTPFGGKTYGEGMSPAAQVLLTSTFWNFGSNHEIARNLVDAAEVVCPVVEDVDDDPADSTGEEG